MAACLCTEPEGELTRGCETVHDPQRASSKPVRSFCLECALLVKVGSWNVFLSLFSLWLSLQTLPSPSFSRGFELLKDAYYMCKRSSPEQMQPSSAHVGALPQGLRFCNCSRGSYIFPGCQQGLLWQGLADLQVRGF